MMKILLTGLVIVVSMMSLKAQENLSVDQKAVQNVVVKLFDALSNLDSVALKVQYTSDLLLLEHGVIWNMDSLISKAIKSKKPADFKRINTIDFVRTEVEGSTAWATYHNRADVTVNGKHRSITWLESVVLVKEKQTWRVKVLHSTIVKRE
jgi:ketosteroid isomerase-like protein